MLDLLTTKTGDKSNIFSIFGSGPGGDADFGSAVYNLNRFTFNPNDPAKNHHYVPIEPKSSTQDLDAMLCSPSKPAKKLSKLDPTLESIIEMKKK